MWWYINDRLLKSDDVQTTLVKTKNEKSPVLSYVSYGGLSNRESLLNFRVNHDITQEISIVRAAAVGNV